jgi:hypothetical protein
MHMLINSQRRFIADASHQLRTPLTVLKTQAELALRECDRPATAQHSRAVLRESCTAWRPPPTPPSGQPAADAGAHRASRRRRTAPVALRRSRARSGWNWRRRPWPEHRPVAGSRAGRQRAGPGLLLHEMLANLVDNALRYTPAGGAVSLRVPAGAGRGAGSRRQRPRHSGRRARTRVRAVLPRRRHAGTQPGGHGLGLAIVRDIATLHGAAITLHEGDGGQGLKARIVFPAGKIALRAPPTAAPRTNMITKEDMVALFADMKQNAPWDINKPLLWGYFFADADKAKLEAAVPALQATGLPAGRHLRFQAGSRQPGAVVAAHRKGRKAHGRHPARAQPAILPVRRRPPAGVLRRHGRRPGLRPRFNRTGCSGVWPYDSVNMANSDPRCHRNSRFASCYWASSC